MRPMHSRALKPLFIILPLKNRNKTLNRDEYRFLTYKITNIATGDTIVSTQTIPSSVLRHQKASGGHGIRLGQHLAASHEAR